MSSNLRVDRILPSTGTEVGVGTATGSVALYGDVNIAGTLTYEDVTNIDSVGVITARNSLHVTSGNVAVGHNNPSVNLHVKGSASNGQIYLGGTGPHSQIYADNDGVLILNADQGNSAANSYLGLNVDNTERLRVFSDGSVRIGDNSIAVAAVGGGPTLAINGAAPEITLRDSATNNPYAVMRTNDFGSLTLEADQGNNAANSTIHFRVDNAERMRINSSYLLHGDTASDLSGTHATMFCGSNHAFQHDGDTGTYLTIAVGPANGTVDLEADARSGGYPDMRFITSNNERLRIDSSGRVLINTGTDGPITTTSGANLQIRATSEAPRIILGRNDSTATTGESLGILGWFGNDGGSYQECARIAAVVDSNHANNDKPTRISFYVCRDNSGSISESWRLRSDGGTQNFSTSTNYDLSNTRSAGNTYEFLYARNNSGSMGAGTLAFKVTNNGNVSNTNGSYGSLSDQRLKENIVDATSQWDDIKGLQIRKYNFRENTGYETHTQIGLIAQEVESISPGLVETSAVKEGETVLDADGNQMESIKSISYSVLYMKAVKALQEAQTRIETLETQLTDALARITALEG